MQLDVQWFIYALADNDIVSAEDAVMFNDELGGDPTLEVFSQELFQAISAELTVVEKAEIQMKFQKITRFAISQASAGTSPSIFEVVEEPVPPVTADADNNGVLTRAAGVVSSGGLMICCGDDAAGRLRLMGQLVRRLEGSFAGRVVADEAAAAAFPAGLRSQITVRTADAGMIPAALEAHADVLCLGEWSDPEMIAPLLECAAGGMAVLLGMPGDGSGAVLAQLIRTAPAGRQHWVRLLLAEAWRGTVTPQQVMLRSMERVCAMVENRLEEMV